MIYSQRRRLVAAARAQFMVFQHFKYPDFCREKKNPRKSRTLVFSDSKAHSQSPFHQPLFMGQKGTGSGVLLSSHQTLRVGFFSLHLENHRLKKID